MKTANHAGQAGQQILQAKAKYIFIEPRLQLASTLELSLCCPGLDA